MEMYPDNSETPAENIKESAVKLYESCAFDQLLGETLRPGGLELTERLARLAGINKNHTVLDIACGKGTTAFLLAREYGCRVIGIDLSDKMISACRRKTDEAKEADRVSFLAGDAENLPFRSGVFDTVISECSFSLLPDKETAARDIKRVLKPGGKLVMTDIILRGEITKALRSQISFACCLAGAWRIGEYVSLFQQIGFQSPYIEDHSHELGKVGYQISIAFGSTDNFLDSLPAGPCRRKGVTDSTPSVESYQKFLKLGRPGYALIAMTRG